MASPFLGDTPSKGIIDDMSEQPNQSTKKGGTPSKAVFFVTVTLPVTEFVTI